MSAPKITEQITPDLFNNLTHKHFQFLEDEFGFSIQKINDWEFVAENLDSKIYIYVEHYAIFVVEIEPIGKAANQLLEKNIFPLRADIIPICKYYCPNIQYQPAILNQKNHIHNIPIEIEQRAKLLKTCLVKMLGGDFSDWARVGQYLS